MAQYVSCAFHGTVRGTLSGTERGHARVFGHVTGGAR